MKGEITEMFYRCGLLIIVIAIGLSGCFGDQGQQAEKNDYKNVSVDQFFQMIHIKLNFQMTRLLGWSYTARQGPWVTSRLRSWYRWGIPM